MEKEFNVHNAHTNKDVVCVNDGKKVTALLYNCEGMPFKQVILSMDMDDISHKILFKSGFEIDGLCKSIAETFSGVVKKKGDNEYFVAYDFSGLFN